MAVARQTLDDLRRRIGDVLERFGDDLADPRDLVAHEDLEDLVSEAAQAVLLLGQYAAFRGALRFPQLLAFITIGVAVLTRRTPPAPH